MLEIKTIFIIVGFFVCITASFFLGRINNDKTYDAIIDDYRRARKRIAELETLSGEHEGRIQVLGNIIRDTKKINRQLRIENQRQAEIYRNLIASGTGTEKSIAKLEEYNRQSREIVEKIIKELQN